MKPLRFLLSSLLCFGVFSIALPSLSFSAPGGFTGNGPAMQGGGFSGPGPAVVTVEQARSMRDDSVVHLRGTIVQHLGKDRYVFRDQTGDITVDIDNDIWAGQQVGPQDIVEIFGEVDKDWNSVEVDVDRLVKVQ